MNALQRLANSIGWQAAPGRLFRVGLLILLADLLFWNHRLGLSLAVFAAALFYLATIDTEPRARLRPAMLLMLGALPVVEYVQTLSLVILASALLISITWARLPEGSLRDIRSSTLRLVGALPLAGLRQMVSWLRMLRHRSPTKAESSGEGRLRTILRNWAFPVGGTLVFASLLADANPVLARLLTWDLDFLTVKRGLFWLGTGLLLWPILDSTIPGPAPAATARRALPRFGINADSSLRALLMFNLLIGAQTLLDLSIFVGGAALPAGMTFASYAHRGAYPLLITALLAGCFALAARPFLHDHRLIRPLMLVWLAQNVALSLSALLRLDLYVEAYGLTYLRVHALIWMLLVAAGLALAGWQVLRARSNIWLLVRLGTLGLTTLYLCCFINFAALIAERNAIRDRPDWWYICSLGPMAASVIEQNPTACGNWHRQNARPVPIDDWRDWGLRKWRVARSLPPPMDPGWHID